MAYETEASTSEVAEAAVGGGRGDPGQCQTWKIILMNYTAVTLMLFFSFFFFFLLVKMFLKKVIDVKTKEMRVLREITEAVLQMTRLIQSSSPTWQVWGCSGCS